jgi:hypothetical protein
MAEPDTSAVGQPRNFLAVLKKLETEVGELANLHELVVGYLASILLARGNLDPARAQRAGLYLSGQLSERTSRLQKLVAAAHDAGAQAALNQDANQTADEPLRVRRA